MEYSRYFIPLSVEDNGFDCKGRPPAGRCVLEERTGTGKVTCIAQDLKPETSYTVYLLFPSKGRVAGLPVGNLPVDEKGKAEARRECDPGNILDSGFKLSDCAGVAVIAHKKPGLLVPLFGSRGEQFQWRNNFYDALAPAMQPALVPASYEPAPETAPVFSTDKYAAPPEPKYTVPESTAAYYPGPEPAEEKICAPPSPPPPEEKICAPPPLPPPEKKTCASPPPTEEETCAPLPTPEENCEAPEPPAEALPEPAPRPRTRAKPRTKPRQRAVKNVNGEPPDTPGQAEQAEPDNCEMDARMQQFFENNESVTPFKKQSRSVTWVKVYKKEQIPVPKNAPGLYNEAFFRTAHDEFGHCIFGTLTDMGRRQYVIGLPCVFDPMQRNQAARIGFSQFKCCEDTALVPGEFGYWLMFINA
ncbi:MAG: hypothetical protein LBR83_04930 [Clostridiales bacterium]|jgi:hypothetical protein|nr:hypothetical protein [Clostridiales bacterium]